MPTPRVHTDQAEKQRVYRQRTKQRQVEALYALPGVPKTPGKARWTGLINAALKHVESVRDEMQTYWDERTERWQNSDRGDAIAARIDQLSTIAIDLSEAAGE